MLIDNLRWECGDLISDQICTCVCTKQLRFLLSRSSVIVYLKNALDDSDYAAQ